MAVPMSDPWEVADAQWSGLDGRIAFDVGAHCGENFGPLARCGVERVVAFEPEEALFGGLMNLAREMLAAPPGVPFVELHCTAVGDRDGTLEMRRANGMLGDLTGQERVKSRCVTLDTASARYGVPDIVVVDVEGFEGQVLDGAPDLLASRHASWLVEFHTEDLYRKVTGTLAGHGYDPVTIRHPSYPHGSGLWRGHGWVKAARP